MEEMLRELTSRRRGEKGRQCIDVSGAKEAVRGGTKEVVWEERGEAL